MAEDGDPAARRAALGQLLGGFAPTPFVVSHRVALPAPGGSRIERLSLVAPGEPAIRGFLVGPPGRWENLPAVLYCHAHGGRYGIGAGELIEGRPALLPEPYGPALARRGVVALCIDLPCFGERASQTESSLSKRLLWEGRTLFGRMLADLAGALDVLGETEGVDASRIGIFGFSMGATLAFWLGALEPRLARVAHACCFADLAALVASGAHDLHGPYMTVPGLLRHFTTGAIAGLCAPRPQLAVMGGLDPLTPPAAVEAAVAALRSFYVGATDALEIRIEPDAGHQETASMRAAIVDFLAAV